MSLLIMEARLVDGSSVSVETCPVALELQLLSRVQTIPDPLPESLISWGSCWLLGTWEMCGMPTQFLC